MGGRATSAHKTANALASPYIRHGEPSWRFCETMVRTDPEGSVGIEKELSVPETILVDEPTAHFQIGWDVARGGRDVFRPIITE